MKPVSEGQAELVPMEQLKERALRNALAVCGGNSILAAGKPGIGRATLYRSIQTYRISAKTGEKR